MKNQKIRLLVTKVLYRKETPVKKFLVVDAGMNDLLRPSLYEAYHDIRPVVERKSEKYRYDVVGPICESGDYLALDREFPELIPGEFFAVMGAGAYGTIMNSTFLLEEVYPSAQFEVVGDAGAGPE